MPAPKEILNLVKRFDANREAFLSGAYSEAQVRVDFIDPFFAALGWDIRNERGFLEPYREVIHEDSLRISGSVEAPDLCFRVGNTRKFFVECKKPSVNLKEGINPAYQLRRYAWSAKLPFSILTDFEEFIVYDCRTKPKENDSPKIARHLYLTYKDYAEKWDEIASYFSREAVLGGSLDKYAQKMKGKRGTEAVDDDFLEQIEHWRELLAKNIATLNPKLTVRELNFAVQQTIDRIIFLRICEDREIESFGSLRTLLNGNNIYKRLMQFFYNADHRYNSGLFHFSTERGRDESPDELSPTLKIDDKPIKEVIEKLYYPSPYAFSVIPAEILGQVYERFLGKVISLTKDHSAKVDEKPEVRKAGGVYYTPTYIVDYIVKNTVGKLLEGKTPKEATKLKILDPACGSGSFLIGAYQYLIDWHRNWYFKDGPQKHQKVMYQTKENEWLLTTAEKKRILINNIFGVDIDTQAVEVTKLSLLLKVLENENQQTLEKQLKLLHERALPDLGHNIKCGNSLIGTDFYGFHQMGLFSDDEKYRINVFDWEKAFPDIMKSGGFDAVIGNPPYVRQEELKNIKEYFQSHYNVFQPTADLYVNFIEKGIKLLKPDGLFGMIISNKWLKAAYGEALRRYLAQDPSVYQIIDFAGLPVFANATVRTIILICSPAKDKKGSITYLAPLPIDDFRAIQHGEQLSEMVEKKAVDLPRSVLSANSWSLSGKREHDLISRIEQNSIPLKSYISCKPMFGIKTGLNEVFIIDKTTRDSFLENDSKYGEIIRPILGGRDVRRYTINFKDKYLIWTYVGVPIERYPAIFKYLKKYQNQLQKRCDKGNHWWELRACVYYDKFAKPKIIYPDIAIDCRFAYDVDGYFGSNTTYIIPSDDLYLLGIFNSRLALFYFSEKCAGLEGGGTTYLRFFGQYLEEFPVRNVKQSCTGERVKRGEIVKLVRQTLDLHKKLAVTKTAHEKTALERQIAATDQQIDKLVYQLYGLTEEEIKIIEESR